MPETGMAKFLAEKPSEAEFKIVMVADSTTEAGITIDTSIEAGQKVAWAIVGMRWMFEAVAAPHLPRGIGAPAMSTGVLQLVRGELPATPVLVGRHDRDLLGEDMIEVSVSTAVGYAVMTWPREVPFMAVTQLPKIHAVFGTEADWAQVSDAAYRISGAVLYRLVTAGEARHEDL